jgi:hypothetical protein
MRADETIGVAALARLLRRLCEAREASVAEQAKELGIRRSTAFAVAASLDATGLAERDGKGRLRAGPAATRLGLAYYGLGAMADVAEALLPVLRDDTDTCVSLIVSKGTSEFEVARRRATWARDADAGTNRIETPSRSINRRLFRDVASISTPDCGRNRAPLGQSLRSACRRRFGRNAAGVGPVSSQPMRKHRGL